MKTTVYRIEHKDTKEGMYRVRGRDLYKIASACGDDIYTDQCRLHPAPEDDSGLMDTDIPKRDISHLHFGFGSIGQLRRWVYKDSWMVGLHAAGFVLAVIETEEAYVGHTQAVFRRPDEYETFDLKEYFNLTDKEIHNDFDF